MEDVTPEEAGEKEQVTQKEVVGEEEPHTKQAMLCVLMPSRTGDLKC